MADLSFYEKHLRPGLRRLAAGIIPSRRNPDRVIAIAGLPRSGTSWLGKTISLAEDTAYYFEPDHLLGKEYWYRSLSTDDRDPVLTEHIRSSLQGRVLDPYVIAEQSLGDLLRRPLAHTAVLKWVRLSISLDWVAANFPGIRVVQIIRHPIPQLLSWRARDWDPEYNLRLLLNQPALTEGPLKPHMQAIASARTYWEKGAAFWSAIAAIQYRTHRPGWYLLEHEWYCLDPDRHFRWIIGELGLKWNSRMDAFLSPDRQVSGPGYGEARDPSSELTKWRGKLSVAQEAEVSRMVARFELPFYRDLEPAAFWSPPELPKK